MHIDDLMNNDNILNESAKIVWARSKKSSGDNVIRKFRCTSGRRIGRLVNHPSDCGKSLDILKSINTKRQLTAQGKRRARLSVKTKKRNPISKRVAKLNKK